MNVSSRNRLLGALSASDRDSVTRVLKPVTLELRQIIEAPGKPIRHVYFVESGVVSVIANSPRDRRIEIALIGAEGMTGLPIVLGDDRSSRESLVQGTGTAWRLPAEEPQRRCDDPVDSAIEEDLASGALPAMSQASSSTPTAAKPVSNGGSASSQALR